MFKHKQVRKTPNDKRTAVDLGRIVTETKGDSGQISDFPVSPSRLNAGLSRD